MQPQIFDAIYQQEKTYWWFVGRRRLIRDCFLRHRARQKADQAHPRLLDVGCGTGAMLDDFAGLGLAVGTDVSPVALQFCRQRGQQSVLFADAAHLPFRSAAFDCVAAMDVIEHIEDDFAVLREFDRVCAPRGVVMLTVPALQWLWTTRDDRLGHKRRYHRRQLIARAEQAGFRVEKASYYCLCMFLAFATVVLGQRFLGRKAVVEQDVPALPPWLNALFRQVLLCEQWFMRWISYPVGVSLFCVLRKLPPENIGNGTDSSLS